MKKIILLSIIACILTLTSSAQQVKLYLKTGQTIQGSLLGLSNLKTEIDPDGSVSYYVVNNVEADSLIYLKDGKKITYPITENIPIKHQSSINITPPKSRSIFSFGLIGGRSSTITTMAFDGFSDTKIKPSFMFGGSVMYFLTNFVAFELIVSHTRSKIIENSEDMGILSMTPIIINYKMQTKPRKKAGVGVSFDIGMGLAFTNYSNGSYIKQLEQEEKVTIAVKTNNPFVFNMGFGLDVFVCKQISLGTDIRLLLSNVKTDWKFNGISMPITEKIFASSFILDFELRYWLDH